MGTDRLSGEKREGRVMPWSLAQDGTQSRDNYSLWIQVEVRRMPVPSMQGQREEELMHSTQEVLNKGLPTGKKN